MQSLTTETGTSPGSPSAARSHRLHRLQGALFQPIGDEGRAELVERRLVDAIHRGHLRAGERLPAESELARSFGVAPVTVREALLTLRGQGLIVTRRGRNGGSFVVDSADPLKFAHAALRQTSRLTLRDMGAHYGAITGAAVQLAARRADPSETHRVLQRLERLDQWDADQQRRMLDDVLLELVALSQSARLTREQMKLQAEFSPYLRLAAADPQGLQTQTATMTDIITAVEHGDPERARRHTNDMVRDVIDALIQLQSSPTSSA